MCGDFMKQSSIISRLPDRPYQKVVNFLDIRGVCNLELVCCDIKQFNNEGDIWQTRGRKDFHGVRLNGEEFDDGGNPRERYRDWYCGEHVINFGGEVFYDGRVQQIDNLANSLFSIPSRDVTRLIDCKFHLPDVSSDSAFFLEIEIRSNPDCVSLSLLDLDNTSVSFSPEFGCVIHETRNTKMVRYMQAMPVLSQQHFTGCVGVLLYRGMLAFFRRQCGKKWDSSGFVR